MQILGRLLIKLDMWTLNGRVAPNVSSQIHGDNLLANIFLRFLIIHLFPSISLARTFFFFKKTVRFDICAFETIFVHEYPSVRLLGPEGKQVGTTPDV